MFYFIFKNLVVLLLWVVMVCCVFVFLFDALLCAVVVQGFQFFRARVLFRFLCVSQARRELCKGLSPFLKDGELGFSVHEASDCRSLCGALVLFCVVLLLSVGLSDC